MIKKLFVVVFLVLVANFYANAQGACSCTGSGCSASQTCPAGKPAVCVCSVTGCSSSCQSREIIQNGIPESDLQTTKVDEFSRVLSSVFGKTIRFTPAKDYKSLKFGSKPITSNNWDVLENLSKNGDLSINGHKIEFWKNIRKTLLEGGEFKICVGDASALRVINEISFISGKRFSVLSGNTDKKITGQIAGNNLSEVIESFRKVSGVTITESN